jgi:hypothetical protein
MASIPPLSFPLDMIFPLWIPLVDGVAAWCHSPHDQAPRGGPARRGHPQLCGYSRRVMRQAGSGR